MKQLALPLFAFDRAIELPAQHIVFDKASARRIDQDGHLFIEMTPISKANVCDYLGSEIPDYDKLGLDPTRIYKLYRDPEELAKAAPTFAGKPLILEHTPVSADEHPREITVGAIGTEVEFKAPYLMAPLSIWDGEAIDLISSEKQKELSCAYRYVADMVGGVAPDGEKYDGIMREIVANHLALVREGRAGKDVVVADSALPPLKEIFEMTKLLSRKGAVAQGALMVFLRPMLAKDAKIDLGPVLASMNAKNFKAKKAAMVTGVTDLTKGKLAKDGKLDGLVELLDALEDVGPTEDEDDPMVDPDDAGMDADPVEAMRGFLKGKMADDDVEKACSMMKPKAMDETPEEKEAREKKEKEEAERKTASDKQARDEEEREKDKDKPTKAAMDAAIKKAEDDATKRAEANTMKRLQGVRIAERAVKPLIGEVTTALDSADAIYMAALKHAGVKTEGVDPSAYPALVEMAVQTKAAAAKPVIHLAHDAAIITDRAAFEKANGIEPLRIRNLG